ncbi:MAG: anaerobic ribonucleoside-triphosphate reductase activating protein [Clostridia bacterium]|nr:anaerobic ribonucleoside-triphosphate reductase activating protein [Clostridia bacterium]
MRYHNITKDDMLNGDGLRVVLWVAGCEHQCPECQNPITWDINGGIEFDESAKKEIFDELDKSYISGITFSGGDPLHTHNRDEVANLIDEIKEKYPDKTIWVYTGYEWDKVKDLPIMEKVDVLVDGKYKKDLRDVNLAWRGSTNQKVISVKNSLKLNEIVLHVK